MRSCLILVLLLSFNYSYSQSQGGLTLISKTTLSGEEYIKKSIKEGDEYNNDSNYVSAIKLYSSVLRVDPNNLEALVKRGSAYILIDEYKKSTTDYWKALQILIAASPNEETNTDRKELAYYHVKDPCQMCSTTGLDTAVIGWERIDYEYSEKGVNYKMNIDAISLSIGKCYDLIPIVGKQIQEKDTLYYCLENDMDFRWIKYGNDGTISFIKENKRKDWVSLFGLIPWYRSSGIVVSR